MNVNNICTSTQNNSIKYASTKMIDFPQDNLMKEVISHMPRETKKEILLNVYDRYKKDFYF